MCVCLFDRLIFVGFFSHMFGVFHDMNSLWRTKRTGSREKQKENQGDHTTHT